MCLLPWLLLTSTAASAEESEDDQTMTEAGGEEMTILGKGGAVQGLPGSAAVLSPAALQAMAPLNTGEALQTLPGVVVAEEDGMGLRLNVGVRGLNPSRSGKLLVLEDGAPIGLGPYGEPALYYSPPIELVERIELVKGSGAILYGPQTIGGVLLYRTAPPPAVPTASVSVRGGSDGYASVVAGAGGQAGGLGYHILALHQRYPSPRSLDLRRTTVHARADVRLPADQRLSLKASFYDEGSDTSYLGLTAAQFDVDPQASFVAYDRFEMRRYAVSARHSAPLSSRTAVETLLYSHLAQRDWLRQDVDRSDEGVDYERIIDGSGQDITGCSPDCPEDGSAVFLANSNSARDRGFVVGGLESRVTSERAWGDVRAGARLHREEILERVFKGQTAATLAGDLDYEAERTADALALWALPRLRLWDDRLQISGGARLELIWTRQAVHRLDGVDQDPPIVSEDQLAVPLPGGGISFDVVKETVALFAGAHRGFAPPRTRDAVSDEGDVLHLDAEYAWTYEAGLRATPPRVAIFAEVTGFLLDFSSQVVVPADGGQALPGGLVNDGESLHSGVEALLSVDPLRWDGGGDGPGLPISVSYTGLRATLGGGWVGEGALEGNRLPYAPPHQAAVALGLEGVGGLSAQVRTVVVGEQFADFANTRAESVDGTLGILPAYSLWSLQARYLHARTGLSAALSVKNLLDAVVITSRAPDGIQTGLPRSVFVEVGWKASAAAPPASAVAPPRR